MGEISKGFSQHVEHGQQRNHEHVLLTSKFVENCIQRKFLIRDLNDEVDSERFIIGREFQSLTARLK